MPRQEDNEGVGVIWLPFLYNQIPTKKEMNHIVYILWSESLQQYYCGQTNDFSDRLYRHNSGQSQFTSRGVPWIEIKQIEVSNRSEAIQLEQKIKKRGIGRYLNDQQQGR